MKHLVIIGNGIAGVTTARHVRKMSDMKITIISAETKYFFSRTALMYVYMGHMRFKEIKPYEDWFWAKNRIDLVHARVNSIDTGYKNLNLDNGSTISYDKLVIATGSKTNKFGWPGQDLPGVQGLYSWHDVELLEKNTKDISHAVIVGGGLIGIELAEMLNTRNIHVTLLVREDLYWNNILPKEDSILISRHILEHGFDLRFNVQLKEILAGEDDRVRSIITDNGEEIDCQLVGLTPGVHPNIELVQNSNVETGRGVLVNDYLETNIPDVYAAGDCVEFKEREPGRFRLEQLWYTGRMHGEALARTICRKRTRYERGIWFNSAKFLDIEYQTYGFVAAKPLDCETHFYWEHKSGKKAVRFVYKNDDHSLVGMNSYGIRYRHELFEKWISENKTVEFVLENLAKANFDPEFFDKHEEEIIEEFNTQNPETNLKSNRGLSEIQV
jgi:NAD(P)H-nitrite reductase large subunit